MTTMATMIIAHRKIFVVLSTGHLTHVRCTGNVHSFSTATTNANSLKKWCLTSSGISPTAETQSGIESDHSLC